MPTISIGMPIYNGEKYVREALDSLLAQTFTDFEILISDNASTDSTEEICKEYLAKDRRVKYTRQSTNQGASANFQIVLNQASGQFFMWASCDDRWSSNWLNNLHSKIVNTNAGMAFGKITSIDSLGKPLSHPANNAQFRYLGSPLKRRIKFYLQNEALGKVNVLFCLYKIEMADCLNTIWDKLARGECVYDFTVAYTCLKYQNLECDEQALMSIRVHQGSEGSNKSLAHGSISKTILRLKSLAWPILNGVILDYFRNSTALEKPLLVLLFPVKLLNGYTFQFSKIYLKVLRGLRS